MYAESRLDRTACHAGNAPARWPAADAPLTRLALIFAHDDPSPAHADTGALPVSLRRQSAHYLVIGGLQWLLDWGVTVWLSHLGMLIEPANITGRVSGAMLGFWLNGKFTFAGDDATLGRVQLQRFAVMWLCTTLASTLAVGMIDDVLGLKWAWLAKPVVELALGVVGFVVSRHWIYRR
jgi:putative flippase GtrA